MLNSIIRIHLYWRQESSFYGRKIKSVPGHHVRIIEKLAELLKDDDISVLGNLIRAKRNTDLYDGGIEVTKKECNEYIHFVEDILEKVSKIIW